MMKMIATIDLFKHIEDYSQTGLINQSMSRDSISVNAAENECSTAVYPLTDSIPSDSVDVHNHIVSVRLLGK